MSVEDLQDPRPSFSFHCSVRFLCLSSFSVVFFIPARNLVVVDNNTTVLSVVTPDDSIVSAPFPDPPHKLPKALQRLHLQGNKTRPEYNAEYVTMATSEQK